MGYVSDILDTKGRAALGIDGSATVYEAIAKMVEGNVGALLVWEGERLAGIVTERDYLRRVTLEGRDERTTPVREIMSTPLVYVSPETPIDECMAVMTARRIRHLPVLTDEREVAGVVSIGDLVKFHSSEQSVQIKFLTEYISG
jgi:CBS domain-containing protein